MTKLDECLDYFMKAVTDSLSVPPWSEWWAANIETVEQIFSLNDYVRLKYRRLLGAQQILQRLGRLPKEFVPPRPQISGTCCKCGERINIESQPLMCVLCGIIGVE